LSAALAAAVPASTAAQEPEPVRISRLRGHLASEFDLPPDDVLLQVPPTLALAPGALISVSAERGIELIDQLRGTRAVQRAAQDVELRDVAGVREDNTMWRQMFGDRTPPPPFFMARVEVTQVQLRSLADEDRRRIAAFAKESRPALGAHRAGREVLVVEDVFVGQVQLELGLDSAEAGEIATVLEGFRLVREPDRPLTLTSAREVAFAFRASRLNFRIEPDAAAEVTLEKAKTTSKNASAWELAEAPREASATAPGPPDGHEVTVLYATCRAVQVEPVSTATRVSQFAATANGLGTLAALAVVLVLLIVVLGFLKRLTWLNLTGVIMVGAALFLAIAWIDARRQQAQAAKITGVYGNKRGELRYGVCQVSIPKKRSVGELNTPFALYVIELPEDPEKHFVVTELRENRDAFFAELKSKVAASAGHNALVFIHGYNVPFADAVKRTAQLTVDLSFAGAPICYSWPSQGDLADYVHDSTNAEIAAYRLKELLADLNEQSGAQEIHLIAHSMGNDVLTRALKELGKDALGQSTCVFREVLLTAPDIDTELFQTQILPAFQSTRQRITLYASSNDKALNASFNLRGSPRAGLAGEHLLVVKGIETIDVSVLDTGFLGHSYYGDHPLVVGDMLQVLRDHLPPGERRLRQSAKNGLPYWEFVP
jgi:esterase/lipase superfamily enzyme